MAHILHWNEFHISRKIREQTDFNGELFMSTGNIILANVKNVRLLTQKLNKLSQIAGHPEKSVKAGELNAMGLIDEIFHYCCSLMREDKNAAAFAETLAALDAGLGKDAADRLLEQFTGEFPPQPVLKGQKTVREYLGESEIDGATKKPRSNRESTLEELILLCLANENPAFSPFYFLFSDKPLSQNPDYTRAWKIIRGEFKKQPLMGPNNNDLITMLKEPVMASPRNLRGQLDYIFKYWASFLGTYLKRFLSGLDLLSEEEKAGWAPMAGGPPPMEPYDYSSLMKEYERYSADQDWMPRVVLLAKTVLVWLTQLSRKYGRDISRLDQIPGEELDDIARRGFTGLWLIGIWERSRASSRIKHLCGNPEAAASAYSLFDYDIAESLGGWPALEDLRGRLMSRGVRLAADMVPNHTGMDAKMVIERPDLFMQSDYCPFPGYTFNGENLSQDSRISVYLEDHYYSRTDCAVVFKRVDNATGRAAYIYHGNDGTGLPWCDTAQIDFLNPAAREEVIQKILHVARNFPIIRFDAAMVLAKKHIRRLWYPEPGQGGDIASRSEHAISQSEFNARIPEEFWREVVDRSAAEAPDTLLLAEAFWMMEGYFVRTLGMHRVYNSAFMNMLKKEENQKYRDTIKNTMEFDPQVLKRFVNFMNNPDEEPALVQFGKGDKYFGVCAMMVTMPGLPMFGHGQIEGFGEKYGMEYTRDYMQETPDQWLIDRHEREIFPLMKKRSLFAEVENFLLYDVWNDGVVNENVFAYSNRFGTEIAIVFYNNTYDRAAGWIKQSASFINKSANRLESRALGDALELTGAENEYCLFREQRSGLWYIRKAQDLCDQGLFIALNGFECQVLLDFSLVHDDETRRYAMLCGELAGRGVFDIDQALWDLFLKDLYAPFAKFLAHAAPALGALLGKAKTAKSIKADANAFCAALETAMDGNFGANGIIRSFEAGKRRGAPRKKVRYAPFTPKARWDHFVRRVGLVTPLMARPRGVNDRKPEHQVQKQIRAAFKANPAAPAVLAGYAMLCSVTDVMGKGATPEQGASLIRFWRLDRKLAELLSQNGHGSYGDIHLLLTMLLETAPLAQERLTSRKLKEAVHKIVTALAGSPAAPYILGVNEFDGARWFNKERMEASLAAILVQFILASAAAPDYALLKKLRDKLAVAEKKSAYKLDEFTAVLEPQRRGRKKLEG